MKLYVRILLAVLCAALLAGMPLIAGKPAPTVSAASAASACAMNTVESLSVHSSA